MNLTIQSLNRVFRSSSHETTALADISLSIHDSERIIISGESGAGKSTLLNIIGLLDRAYEGTYSIDGISAKQLTSSQLAKYRSDIFSYIYQEHALLEHETVFENIRIPLIHKTYRKKQQIAMTREVLALVGLEDTLDRKVSELSGGQRQRISLCRALVKKPSIILADEPTSALDPKTSHEILDVIYRYLDKDKILIVSTHDPRPFERGNHRHLILDQGKLIHDESI